MTKSLHILIYYVSDVRYNTLYILDVQYHQVSYNIIYQYYIRLAYIVAAFFMYKLLFCISVYMRNLNFIVTNSIFINKSIYILLQKCFQVSRIK